MATRNVLDSLGNVVGTLTMPDSTSELDWQAALANYSTTPTIPSPPSILSSVNLIGSGSVTTSSSQTSVIGGMSTMPTKGKYVAFFSGSIFTGGASATGEFGIYIDGSLVAESRRDISCNLQLLGGLVTISLNQIGVGTYTGTQLDLSGSQTVEVRFRSTNGGVIGFNERVLTLLKVQ